MGLDYWDFSPDFWVVNWGHIGQLSVKAVETNDLVVLIGCNRFVTIQCTCPLLGEGDENLPHS